MSTQDQKYAFLTRWLQMAFSQPEPVEEFKFAPDRKWRFDYAWPDLKIAVEIDGGVYSEGRHTRGQGYERDCEKLNAAVLLGWRVFRFTTGMLERDPMSCINTVLHAVIGERKDRVKTW